MVADFVSADYGWLHSPDKANLKKARVFFKARKNCEGYFTNADILSQITTGMDILTEFYPDDEHKFVFDNATTHTAQSDSALSACQIVFKSPVWSGLFAFFGKTRLQPVF
jgi:hypothetical protein